MKALFGTSSTSLCSMSSVDVAIEFYSQCVERNQLACQWSRFLGDSHGTPLANCSMRRKPFQVLEASFGDKRCSVGLCLLCSLSVSLRSLSRMYISEELSTVLGFHRTP